MCVWKIKTLRCFAILVRRMCLLVLGSMASTVPDSDPPPDFLDEVVAFKALVGSVSPPPRSSSSQFVKKLD